MPDHIDNYPTSDAGPYSSDQWRERIALAGTVGDPSTANERAQLRGVIPTVWDKLVVTNPATKTMTVDNGAAVVNGNVFVHDPTVAPATISFDPSIPVADRIDRVVVCMNNTNVVYNTNLEFPTDLTDYNGTASIEPYSCRLAILTGNVGGAMRNLVQTTDYWMIELSRYTIDNGGNITVGPTDYREFACIQNIVGVHSDDDDTVKDALILGTQVDDAAGGDDNLGVAILWRLEDDSGELEDAGRLEMRWSDASNGAEDSRYEFRTLAAGTENLSGVIEAPTIASADGNARGAAAVDWQGWRSAAAQVASGVRSVIGGGSENIASGVTSTVSGGNINTASGSYSTVGGGSTNTASGSESTVAGGGLNQATGLDSVVSGGTVNLASGDYSVVLGGDQNDATGDLSTAAGEYALADKWGQFAHASGSTSVEGDAQGTIQLVARCTAVHNNANWNTLYLDGAGALQRMTIAASSAWTFDALVVGITLNAGAQWGYRIVGLIERDNAGNTTLAASTVTTIFESDANFAAQAVADDANEALSIQVSDAGSSGVTVRWVATVRTAEVIFPW
jgi:hypothetical protein